VKYSFLRPFQLSLWGVRRTTKPEVSQPACRKRKRVRHAQSDGELHKTWRALRAEWFPEAPELDDYAICWSSRRQKRTLASCSLETRRIRVARELSYAEHRVWLGPLLYHEMCHAYLARGGPVRDNPAAKRRACGHGAEFKAIERRFPGIAALDAWIKGGGWMRAVRSDRAKRASARKGPRIPAPAAAL